MVSSGGMGLTGGIADIGSLYESLVGIHTGVADDFILDKYDEIRRQIWHEIINPISSANIRRLIDLDPDTAVEQDPVLQMLKRLQESIDKGIPPPPGQTSTVRLKLRRLQVNSPTADLLCQYTCSILMCFSYRTQDTMRLRHDMTQYYSKSE